jgi:uncharacterized protein YlxW (UPF0749 family)
VQDVVNALWSAGARAIAVGGERLGPTTAIRSAGQAILVDFRPITSPYVIVALGSPDTLAGRFAASAAVSRLRAASSAYGIGFSVQSVGHERLPPAADVAPRYAQPLEGAQ